MGGVDFLGGRHSNDGYLSSYTGAMILAFVGAVEQNLLELPARPVESLKAGHLINVAETLLYLEEYLNG